MLKIGEKCRSLAESEERARKQQTEVHAKLTTQVELCRELEVIVRKAGDEENALQEQLQQLRLQWNQERENARRAEQRAAVRSLSLLHAASYLFYIAC